ncbi:hypothetical protein [Candidatus Poriferisodalis sp.]|uniref:hypothetical protein n=1 Tax=Candidatus Poriferisodalis sp. TaxID=3101277 RepID=UPI003B01111C
MAEPLGDRRCAGLGALGDDDLDAFAPLVALSSQKAAEGRRLHPSHTIRRRSHTITVSRPETSKSRTLGISILWS